MHPNDIHHIKAYIIFFVVSFLSVGILIYLYLPIEAHDDIRSSVIQDDVKKPQTISSEIVPSDITQKNVSSESSSNRRVRLTKILMRTKKELQTLEEQRKVSPGGLDPQVEKEISELRKKISTIEANIAAIK